jgi:hypothetical protein
MIPNFSRSDLFLVNESSWKFNGLCQKEHPILKKLMKDKPRLAHKLIIDWRGIWVVEPIDEKALEKKEKMDKGKIFKGIFCFKYSNKIRIQSADTASYG